MSCIFVRTWLVFPEKLARVSNFSRKIKFRERMHERKKHRGRGLNHYVRVNIRIIEANTLNRIALTREGAGEEGRGGKRE